MVGAKLGLVDGTTEGKGDALGLLDTGDDGPPLVARGTATA
eukprot:CAMPEP_0195250912 /NCGR_PEP_ID=MMETSP0706-20130129/2972_1 /TAXON_ID=33640 /ORGANISM="Asterionellopsis glacialis, Strain CCMP134" /LENGTH=40 /DNA_ID= /DNA_START= /DNA_END= /DNA_ORIENTATION=